MANRFRYSAIAAFFCFLLLSTSCLTVADDEGPILSVELYWDEEPDRGFVGGTCDTAGVDTMEWHLLEVLDNGDEDEVQTNISGSRDSTHPCYNAIDILDLPAGTYRLEISGYDSEGQQLWTETSGDLQVLRFDVSYRFDIPQS